MLYQTLQQPKLLVVFLITGFVCGSLFDVGNFIKFLCLNKKIAIIILDLIQTAIVLFIIFIVNLQFNYGEIRIFPLLIFLFAFVIEKITLSKMFVKFYKACYNRFIKLNERIRGYCRNDKTNKSN